MAKDPLGAFNLTSDSIVHCVKTILNTPHLKRTPTMLLGGGGYNIANAARLWTSVTAQVLNRKISNDIPDNLVSEKCVKTCYNVNKMLFLLNILFLFSVFLKIWTGF